MSTVTRKGIESYQLYEGDQITVGITHQIDVGRDRSWVKYEAITKVRPDEKTEDARTRAIGHVNQSVQQAVTKNVETIRSQQ
jgi:hypothetical protein